MLAGIVALFSSWHTRRDVDEARVLLLDVLDALIALSSGRDDREPQRFLEPAIATTLTPDLVSTKVQW